MPRTGQTIGGKYVLAERVGEGSMGSVWKAVHQTLGRPFAVKFLKSYGAESDRLEQRFLQEAKLAAAIQHRFVVGIFDFGLTEEGTPYMVMEYLEGESLAERLARRPQLPARELVRLVAQALVGLEAVHQAGVIHRDLKPENVVLVAEAGGAIPKLVDFGISRPEAVPSRKPTHLTEPGTAMGTPWYMSPEQVRGLALDRRTDVYSVGVVLYLALTGGYPYQGETVAALLDRIVEGGAASLTVVRPEVGRPLAATIDRALALAPEDRFATAAEMAAALFALLPHLAEDVTCPLLTATGATSRVRARPGSIIPGAAEISADMLAPTSWTNRGAQGPSSRRRLWLAGAVAAMALGGALVWKRSVGDDGRPRGTAAAVGESAPAPVAPALPPEPPPAAPAAETAVEPPREAEAPKPALRRRASSRKTRAPKRGADPPEAFTNPGF